MSSINEQSSQQNNQNTLKNTSWRWLVLFLLNLTLAGDYFCYDNPQALQSYLQQDLNIDAAKYSLLYSVYSLPNIILPLVAGRMIDFFGVRIATIFYASLILLGQILVTFAGYSENFWLMFAGRAIYGFGGDSLSVCETFFVTEWFGGLELAFAFSFQDVVSGLFEGTNAFLTPRLYNYGNKLGLPLLFGAILCLISLLSAIGVAIIDRINDNIEGRVTAKVYVKEGEEINIREMFNMPLLYWLIIINYGLQSGAFYSFTNIANNYLVQRYGFDPVIAGTVLAITVYGIGGFFPPFWGKIIDTFGQRVILTFIVALLLFTSNLLFLTSKDCTNACYWPFPVIPLILLGLFISATDSVTYPSFPIFLPATKLATSYAGAWCFQNIILTIDPTIVGVIIDSAPDYNIGYIRVSLFLLSTSCIGLIVIGLIYWENRKGYKLHLVFQENVHLPQYIEEDQESLIIDNIQLTANADT